MGIQNKGTLLTVDLELQSILTKTVDKTICLQFIQYY